ncbi:MAG: cytidylate kinase family protein [Deltaproteobacteria bacterium]|jgi:cytidylate kinase|nr:cytidylate kinase family protein [Deltaproteobacteria bacterium]
MLITITGKLGSGKSTICRGLSERCKFQVYSTGEIHRNLANRMGLDTLALNKLMSGDSSYDRAIDDEVKRIASECRDAALIFDSRLAWHFVECSVKLFTTVDPVVAAQRVFKAPRGDEERYADIDDALANLKLRARLERDRFKGIYGVDYYDYSNFDLIVDTTWLEPELLVSLIVSEASKIDCSQPPKSEILISPKSLYPTREAHEGGLPPEDNFRSEPLEVFCQDGYHFVVGDNTPLAAAQEANLPFVFARLAASPVPGRLQGLNLGLVAKAQARGDFRYASLPDAYKTPGQ